MQILIIDTYISNLHTHTYVFNTGALSKIDSKSHFDSNTVHHGLPAASAYSGAQLCVSPTDATADEAGRRRGGPGP